MIEIIENCVRERETEDKGSDAPKIPDEDLPYTVRKMTKTVIAMLMGEDKAREVDDLEQDIGEIARDTCRMFDTDAWARRLLTESVLLELGIYMYVEGGAGEEIFLLPFEKRFKKKNLNGYYIPDKEFWECKQARGLQARGEILLGVDEEDTVQHEFQHLLDRALCLGVKKIKEEPGWEYRARLAELLFVTDPEKSMEKMLEDSEGLEEGMAVTLDYHATGNALFTLRTNLFRDNDLDRILPEAKEELDDQYLGLVGLTYDEILEPFIK